MKLLFFIIIFSSCTSGRIISTNEYYADGLVEDCHGNKNWGICQKNLIESYSIYQELGLKNKQALVVARIINIVHQHGKIKYLPKINHMISVIGDSKYSEDIKLLFNLVKSSLNKKEKYINNIAKNTLLNSKISLRKIYIVCKFKQWLNEEVENLLVEIIKGQNLDLINKDNENFYYSKKIKQIYSIK